MEESHLLPDSETASRWARWFERWRPWLIALAVTVVGGLLFDTLHGLTRELSYAEMMRAIRATPTTQILLAVLATAVSFVSLTGYDRSALRYVGVRLPYRIVAPTSFIAYALGNTIGLGVLTGGAVRMRLYAAAGVEVGQITRAIAFNAMAFGLGITVVGAVALLWAAPAVAAEMGMPAWALRGGSTLILGAAAVLLWLCHDGRQQRVGRFTLRLPDRSLALQQLAISAVDIAASAMVLWLLLPAGSVSLPSFVGFYAVAVVLGVLSHVPGGLGVFEAVMLVALGNKVPTEALAGALILYRLIYYVLPLGLALLLLVITELRSGIAAPVARAAAELTPMLLAGFTLVVGVMLLLSGAMPATQGAVQWLAVQVPLPVVEASHFLGSIAGLMLLFVARGMLLRLDAAWWLGLVIAAASAVLALPKGLSLSECLVLAFLVTALVASRRQFTRKASLFAQPFDGGWLLAIALIVLTTVWVLFFVYRDVQYGSDLWWQFAFDAHAPRSLRATVAAAVLALAFALWQLLRPRAQPLARPDAASLDAAARIVDAQERADGGLALMGDKYFLFSESQQTFLMFGRRGRSWVALAEPIGPLREWPELIWRFIELAREQGGRPAFYQVRPQQLPLFLDAGLQLLKLGEEAHVPLPTFSLAGPKRATLRHGVSRGEREGLSFEVLEVDQVPSVLEEIRAISDAWLAQHEAAEKRFSLGAFETAYVLRQPVAVVRQGARVVAFATVMRTARKVEVSVDLMRHVADMPKGTMDFLFGRLMLHYQAEGFQRFGLGMAPLSGMADHPLAPRWHRMGRVLFAHGEHFYNFQGLRAFKEKFDPVWEARYLAAPGGIAPLLVLTDVAALIGGGLRGVIAR